jgi:Zn-finger nucleic acid-binding protein
MSVYTMFETDAALEKDGVWVDYGEFRVLLARAGGANKLFSKTMNAKVRPYKRMIESDTMPEDISERILQESYAAAVVRDWQVRRDGEWVTGMDPLTEAHNEVMAFNQDNVIATFKRVPDLFYDLVKQAQNFTLYKTHLVEDDLKN